MMTTRWGPALLGLALGVVAYCALHADSTTGYLLFALLIVAIVYGVVWVGDH